MIDAVPNDPIRNEARLAAVRRSGLLDTEPDESFDRLAELARELLEAPFAFITVVDDHRSFWKSCMGVDLTEDAPHQNSVEESFCQYVVSSGKPLMLADARLDPITRDNPAIATMGVVAWAGYPVFTADRQVLGSFCVVDTVPRQWTATHARVLKTLAEVASTEVALRATALDLRHLAQEARRVGALAETERVRAERANARSQLLVRSSELLTAGLESDTVLAAITRLVVPDLCDAAVVYTLDRHRRIRPRMASVRHRDPTCQTRLEAAVLALAPRLDDVSGPGYVLATGRSQIVDATPVVLADVELANALCVPLKVRGDIVGGLHLLSSAPTGFSSDDLALAQEIAQRAALALDNAVLYAEQHDTAVALQQALLTAPPQPDQLELEARYLPAAKRAQVGGDWYDAFEQRDGALVLVIGDVAGHDLRATANMSQLRTLVRGIAYHSQDTPGRVLMHADDAIRGLDVDTTATAVVARIEQCDNVREIGLRRVRWSNAGHPPPMLVRPDGTVSILATRPDLLLGVLPDSDRADHEAELPAGSTLLLYTDGLIERRDEPLQVSIEQLADHVADLHSLALDKLCDALLARLVPGAPEDDVALIAVRAHPER